MTLGRYPTCRQVLIQLLCGCLRPPVARGKELVLVILFTDGKVRLRLCFFAQLLLDVLQPYKQNTRNKWTKSIQTQLLKYGELWHSFFLLQINNHALQTKTCHYVCIYKPSTQIRTSVYFLNHRPMFRMYTYLTVAQLRLTSTLFQMWGAGWLQQWPIYKQIRC